MLCPLMFSNSTVMSPDDCGCLGEKCAWWIKKTYTEIIRNYPINWKRDEYGVTLDKNGKCIDDKEKEKYIKREEKIQYESCAIKLIAEK